MRMLEIHIEVDDVERSLELYAALLPHSKIKWWKDRDAAALVLEDGSAFGIWKKGKLGLHKGRAGEHLHFAFQIESDEYEEYKNKIESLGLAPLEHEWRCGEKSIYFFDYDGNQGEFMTTDWFSEL